MNLPTFGGGGYSGMPQYQGQTFNVQSGLNPLGDIAGEQNMFANLQNYQALLQALGPGAISNQMFGAATGLTNVAGQGAGNLENIARLLMGGGQSKGPVITRGMQPQGLDEMGYAKLATQTQDPFGGQRAGYQTQLADMEEQIASFMANPSGYIGTNPRGGGFAGAYQQGLQQAIQAGERSAAQRGTLGGGTGATDIAAVTADYFNKYYGSTLQSMQNQADQLARLSGAQFAPTGQYMAQAGTQGQQQKQFEEEMRMKGLGGAGSLFGQAAELGYKGESDYMQVFLQLMQDLAKSGVSSGGGAGAPPGFSQAPFMGG